MTRLPAERSSFVGRRADLARLRGLLADSRLVTLVGPGGVGKTRLALRAAGELRRSFPGGVVLADLTEVTEPALAAGRVAAAFDVRDSTGRWLPAALADVLGERRVLLVLDNCEHLRDACAVLVDALLPACPGLSVLATSRVPLGVPGEALCAVPPLTGAEGVELIEQRARAAAPDLALTPEDGGVLAELCRRLDGLPLAIELATVRLRTLTPVQLLDRLDDRFVLLRRPGPAGPERHRTLRATMLWSAELLDERERVLWRRASVFAAGFDLAAAEAVCADGGLPGQDLLDALGGLVDASLLVVDRAGAAPTFRMLETVRAFGRELLSASGEAGAVRRRHRDWCAGLVSAAAAEFLGPGQVAAFDRIAAVHAELGPTLEHCLSTPGEQPAGLATAADAWLYWAARGHLGEGRRWLDLLLQAVPAPCPDRARALVVAGYLALVATDPEAAVPLLEEGRRGARSPELVALATQYLGQAALFRGELPAAEHLLRTAAGAHGSLEAPAAAFCWADVGVVALLAGDLDAADAAFGTSLDAAADPWTRSHALWGRGLVRLAGGDPTAAGRLEAQALWLMREIDDRSGVALCVAALGWVAAARGDADRAAVLAGIADAVWRSIPARLPAPLAATDDRWTGRARCALGERRWAERHAEGTALDRATAVALVLGERPAPPSPAPPSGPLTGRQWEVAGLVAEGLTDREIAARLFVSPRTVETHVEHILRRLGFRSRAQIAAWKAGRG